VTRTRLWESGEGERAYQSIDWGGSSFEWEVFTVSTQPAKQSHNRQQSNSSLSVYHLKLMVREAFGVSTNLEWVVSLVSSGMPSMH